MQLPNDYSTVIANNSTSSMFVHTWNSICALEKKREKNKREFSWSIEFHLERTMNICVCCQCYWLQSCMANILCMHSYDSHIQSAYYINWKVDARIFYMQTIFLKLQRQQQQQQEQSIWISIGNNVFLLAITFVTAFKGLWKQTLLKCNQCKFQIICNLHSNIASVTLKCFTNYKAIV